jgi:hypothetical protein
VTKPPQRMDGAIVLQVADLAGVLPLGRTRHVVAGQEVSEFSSLVLARYDEDRGVYLFYCDESWNVVTDTYHRDLAGAVAQAEFEYGPLQFSAVGT